MTTQVLQKNTKPARGMNFVLALFGLPFLGAGLFILKLTVNNLEDARQMQDWHAVEATLDRVDIHRNDDTAKVVATYQYQWGGTKYQGDRVGVSSGGDNIGSWQRDTYKRLNSAKKKRQSITCYVNPANPKEAVIDPELRVNFTFGMALFACVFCLTGASISTFGLINFIGGGGGIFRASDRRVLHPSMPRSDWRQGFATPQENAHFLVLLCITAFSTLLALLLYHYFHIYLFDKPMITWGLLGAGLLIAGCGLVLLRKIRNRLRFGNLRLYFGEYQVPFTPGSPYQLHIASGRPVNRHFARDLQASLVYSLKKTIQQGSKRHHVTEEVWSETLDEPLRIEAHKTGSSLPITLAIPNQIPHLPKDFARQQASADEEIWQLRLDGLRSLNGFKRTFAIPVDFDPSAPPPSSSDLEYQVLGAGGTQPNSPPPLETIPESRLASLKITRSLDDNGMISYLKAPPLGLRGAIPMLLFGGLFLGIAVLVIFPDNRLFSIPFLLVGALICTTSLALTRLKWALQIDPKTQQLHRWIRLFGKNFHLSLPLSEISHIGVHQCGMVNNRPLFSIRAYRLAPNKGKHAILWPLNHSQRAHQLASQIENEIKQKFLQH